MSEYIAAFGGNITVAILFGISYVIYKKSNCSYKSDTGWDINFQNKDEDEDSEDEHISDIIGSLLKRKDTKRRKRESDSSKSESKELKEIKIINNI